MLSRLLKKNRKTLSSQLNYSPLEPKTLMAVGSLGFTDWTASGENYSTETVARLADAYENESATSPWSFLWNAPTKWEGANNIGIGTTGIVGDIKNYRALSRNSGTSVWSVDGDGNPLNGLPGNQLRISPTGWHPGLAFSNGSEQDRFSLVAFRVTESGFYRFANSRLLVSASSLDGIELHVHVENEFRFSRNFDAGFSGSFDQNIGYVAAGDRIYFGIGGNSGFTGDFVQPDFELERVLPRDAPLRQLQGTVTHVDISNNPTLVIQQALDSATNGQRFQFTAESSEVTIYPSNSSSNYMLDLVRKQNIELDFSGLTLNLNDRSKGFLRILGSSNVIIRNAEIDYTSSALPFTQGVISRVESNRVQFDLSEGFEPPLDPMNPGASDFNVRVTGRPRYDVYAYPVSTDGSGRLVEGAEIHYAGRFENNVRLTKVANTNSRYQISLNSTVGLAVGDGFVVQLRKNVSGFGVFQGGDQITLSGVTMYSSPGAFVSTVGGNHINVIDSHVKIKPGRWKSINADAVHIQSSRNGAWVENSSFNGLGDDVMTFYSFPMVMTGFTLLNGDSQVGILQVNTHARNFQESAQNYQKRVLGSVKAWTLQAGDRYTFYNPRFGTNRSGPAGFLTLKSWVVDPASSGNVTDLIFEEEIVTGDGSIVDGNDLDIRDNWTLYNQSYAKNFVVKGSQFLNSKRHGLYAMSSRTQILDNLFSGLAGQSIAGQNESGWPLGLFARNVLIQGNRFEGNMHGRFAANLEFYAGDVSFFATRFENATHRSVFVNQPWYYYRNLEIRDNSFYHWRKSSITLRNAGQVNIVGNRFFAPQKYLDLWNDDDVINYRPDDPHRLDSNEAVRLSFVRTGAVYGNVATDIGVNSPGITEIGIRSPLYNVIGVTVETIPNVVSSGLVSWYKFDRRRFSSPMLGIGDDSSTNSAFNRITLYDGYQTRNLNQISSLINQISLPGKFESGLNLDGINDRAVFMPAANVNQTSLNKRTVSLWANITQAALNSSLPLVLYDEGSFGRGFNIYLSAGRIIIGMWDGVTSTFLEMPASTGWQHIAFVLDASEQEIWQANTFRAFLNGNQISQGSGKKIGARIGDIGIGAAAASTRFRGVSNQTSGYVAGQLDDLRIYNRSLTPQEILILANRRLI